jgi:hypothetical protein
MSSHVWCHGTKCHKSHTQDRVRGSKGSKVLRTRKVKQHNTSSWYSANDIMNYFCSQGCLMDFLRINAQRVVAIAPRNEPLETPINDPEKTEDYYGWKITERGVDTITE